ncbi:putative transporter [Lachnellula subtilissima]|uniref:Putative transporter n=1 Tax=Lachnellula subtilissima TaxID=602034 RepID=A0A8H8RV17_9HELO|nr:putative transporter [Lachnellula subtilissima]
MHAKRQGRAWYHWYAKDDSPEERKLIIKLDLLIVPYAVIAYWIKYIDQSNLIHGNIISYLSWPNKHLQPANAYVSGLKEDLAFNANQLVNLNAMYIAGAVIGQLPFTFYRAQGYGELMAYRFLVGIFEAAFFPGVHYVLGAWYRGDELGRRGGVFYVGQMLGTLTAGLIQSGASANLDGVRGMAGWRWMFIISALMTIPVAIAGVFIWPGTPAKPNKLFLSDSELELAIKRLTDDQADPSATSTQDCYGSESVCPYYLGYLLLERGIEWLRRISPLAQKPQALPHPKVNQLGTTAPALGIFYVLFVNFSSDLLWGPSGAIAFAHAWNFTAMVILATWNVPESAKWFAFNSTYTQVAMSSVLYGWANDILRHDATERSVILTFMNLFAQSTTAWTGVLVFPTTEGPRFLKGWTFCAVNSFLLVVFTYAVIGPMARRQERNLDSETSSGEESRDTERERDIAKGPTERQNSRQATRSNPIWELARVR